MKSPLILLALLIWQGSALGQSQRLINVHFEKDTTVVYEDSTTNIYESVRVVVETDGELSDQDSLVLCVKDKREGDASILDYQFTPSEHIFSVTKSSGRLFTFSILVLRDNKKESDETILLRLENKLCKGDGLNCNALDKHVILIKDPLEKKESVLNFRLLAGANFDFNDGISASNVYGALNVFLPRCFSEKWGFYGGLYNTQSVSVDSSNVPRVYSHFSNFNPLTSKPGDTLNAVSEYYTTRSNTTIKNIALYGAVTYQIHKYENKKTNLQSLLYLGMYVEAMKRNYYTNFDYTSTRPNDTVMVTYPTSRVSSLYARPLSHSTSIYETYFGICFPFQVDCKAVELRLNPVLGGNYLRNNLGGFYMVNFSVMEKYTGITLGGEWRSVNHNGIGSVYTTLYLSKTFPLSKLKDYLTLN